MHDAEFVKESDMFFTVFIFGWKAPVFMPRNIPDGNLAGHPR